MSEKRYTEKQVHQFLQNMQGAFQTALYRRMAMLRQAGIGDGMGRDYDREFKFPKFISKEMYKHLYDRNAVANRVVTLYPQACWLSDPIVYDYEKPQESEFEKAWKALAKKHNLYTFLKRADILSGIGAYGVILLGIDDRKPLHEPVEGVTHDTENLKQGKHKLLYLNVFPHTQVTIKKFDSDVTSPRYGQPEMYTITFAAMENTSELESGQLGTREQNVHWTRIIHVADNRESSETFGVPRLQVVFNAVLSHLKITGASGEMFYWGAMPGLAIESTDKDGTGGKFDVESTMQQLDYYFNGMQRFIGLDNAHANSLSPQAIDPGPHARIQLEDICIFLGCPLRVFMGSEAGHLASDQDQESWNNNVMERENKYVGPLMVRPLAYRLVQIGALPVPKDNTFTIDWPDLNTDTESERADVLVKRTQAYSTYANGRLPEVIPPQQYMTVMDSMDEEEARGIIAAAAALNAEHEDEHDDNDPDGWDDDDDDDEPGAAVVVRN